MWKSSAGLKICFQWSWAPLLQFSHVYLLSFSSLLPEDQSLNFIFLFGGYLTPPQKKSILLVSTDHHIPKVKKLYQQCIQDSLSGASAWVSRNNSKSHIEKVCPFLIFSWLFWWSPKREPQFGAGISWTPDAPRALCGAGSLAGNSLQIHHHASALFSLHALCGCLPFTAGEAKLPLTAVL